MYQSDGNGETKRAGVLEVRKLISVLIALIVFSVSAYSQIVYPLTLKLQWDPAPVDEITTFSIKLDNNPVADPPYASVCTATVCSQSFQVPNANNHTICLSAT